MDIKNFLEKIKCWCTNTKCQRVKRDTGERFISHENGGHTYTHPYRKTKTYCALDSEAVNERKSLCMYSLLKILHIVLDREIETGPFYNVEYVCVLDVVMKTNENVK